MMQKKRVKKKNKGQKNQRSYEAYFNYLPFEKEVIKSKGKSPLNNREAEMIMNARQNNQNGTWQNGEIDRQLNEY